MKKFLFAAALGLISAIAPAQDPPEVRAVYVPTFDTNTAAKADTIIAEVLSGNINQVYVQVRSRADSYYIPNREDSTYPNSEPRAQQYSVSPSDLDVLQYYIDRLHNAPQPVEVHAWLTTYNSWASATAPSSASHIYNDHPEWITENEAGTTYTYANDAPLDPGIPAVQDHLYNVFLDVVRNYDVDGIHFDYVRLLGSDSGYDPVAKAQFLADTGWNYDTQNTGGQLDEVYETWRRDQIAKLVQRIHDQTVLEKPWVDVSAFVVNFTDSVENLAQGYNWWVANGKIDTIHLEAYSSTRAGAISDHNEIVAKLAQNGDENTRPLVDAIGSYLFLDSGDPTQHDEVVTDLRGNSRPTDGFNFFTHDSIYKDGTPDDQLAQALFNTGGPMDDWAPVPSPAHKVAIGEEFTAPNAPASAGVSLVSGAPRVSFNRPAAAADGDLPVHYRLYRDTTNPPDLYYENMVMEWWDADSSTANFSFDDVTAPASQVYYTIVAYDDWNNAAATTVGPVTPTMATEYIIETRTGGLNFADYSETGTFSNSSSQSSAPGTTPGIGSRFALPGDANGRNDQARFSANDLPTGTYDVYVTTFNFGSANALDITVRESDANGVNTSTIDLTSGNAGNVWYLAGSMNVTNGAGHYIEFDNSTQSNIGDVTDSRMNAAAVRFVRTDLSPVAKEPKPAVTEPESAVIEVIVDSEPVSLNYDDDGAAGGWSSSSFGGGSFGGSSRFFSNANYPFDAVSTWVVDLPVSGKWAIDGYIRNNTDLAEGAQYRFVDGSGTVQNVTTTQRTGSSDIATGGWLINVDGVTDDDNAFDFNKGHVYVTLYGNTTGSQILFADALRFRLVDESSVSDWAIFE